MKGDSIDKNVVAAPLRGGLPVAGAAHDRTARAWQREMERAQMQAWLSHAVIAVPSPARAAASASGVIVAATTTMAATPQAAALGRREDTDTRTDMAAADTLPRHEPLLIPARTRDTQHVRGADQTAPHPLAETPTKGFERHRASDRPFVELNEHAASSGARDVTRPAREESPFVRISTQRLESVLRDLAAEVSTSLAGQVDRPKGATQAFPVPAGAAALPLRVDAASLTVHAVDVFNDNTATVASRAIPSTSSSPGNSAPAQSPPAFALESASAITIPTGNTKPTVAATRGQEAAVREPIRVHADWNSEGVRLWLGVDASLAAALPAITAQLQRWLSNQGVRLLSMSCNGRIVGDPKHVSPADPFEANNNNPDAAIASVDHPILKEVS